MNTKALKIIKILLPIVLGVFLIWYSLSKLSFAELLNYFKNANYFWVAIGILLGVLSHLSRAYRWLYLLNPLGYQIKLPNSIMAVFAAYLINYTIPRAGEIARATLLNNYENIPFEKGFGTIVAERIADILVMLFIIGIALILEYQFIYEYLFYNLNSTTLMVGVLSFLIIGFLVYYLLKKSTSSLALRIKSFFNGLLEGITSIFKMQHKWKFFAHTIFIWLMYILMFYTTSFAIPELKDISFSAILISFIAASFSIAATNGGIGSYPVAIYAAFSLYGIPKEPSLAFGWILWSSQTLMLIILGGISLLYLPIYNSKK